MSSNLRPARVIKGGTKNSRYVSKSYPNYQTPATVCVFLNSDNYSKYTYYNVETYSIHIPNERLGSSPGISAVGASTLARRFATHSWIYYLKASN